MEEKNNNGINVVAVRKKILDEEKRMKYDNNLIKQKARTEKAAKKRKEEIQKVKERAQVFNNKVQAFAERRKRQMEEKKNQSPEHNRTVEKTEYKFPSYEEFRASACSQYFSLPESILYYMAKNPPLPEIHQKLLRCCKYFFIKNPVIYFHCLRYDDIDKWQTCKLTCCKNKCFKKYRKIDLDKIQCKIQVSVLLNISSSNPSMSSSLFRKFYNGNVGALMLKRQHVSFNQLLFFSQNLEHLSLEECTVLFENGTEVPCDKIIAMCPKLQSFSYVVRPNYVPDCANMAQELLKIRHFKNMRAFRYGGLSESFDIDTFLPYLKENKRTNVFVRYNDPLSQEYISKLQVITNQIIDDDSPRPYFTPLILFNGQTRNLELFKLWFRFVLV